MGTCSECKHAVFGAIGNYCAVDRHGIKADDRCTIGEFVKYEPPKPVLTSPPCAGKCDKSTCAGCDDEDEAYTLSGWWSPSSSLTQLEFIASCVHNSDNSGDVADHYVLAKFVMALRHLDRIISARVEKNEFSIVTPAGLSDSYIRSVSTSLSCVGTAESFTSIKAAEAAKRFIDQLIDEYDARTSVALNGSRYYYDPQTPSTSLSMMLRINDEKIELDFSPDTTTEEIARVMNQNLDDRGISGVQASTDNGPDMQIISMSHGDRIFDIEEITEAYQNVIAISRFGEDYEFKFEFDDGADVMHEKDVTDDNT